MKPENFSPPPGALPCRVSVVIKAFNEEKRICAAIESALRAIAGVGGEVVLADACSSDRTVERARAYPIRIVQFSHPEERRCGAGPQLGFQHSCGEFIYLLDGDMEMLDGFLVPALGFMKAHPDIAGVGGQMLEQNTRSLEYVARTQRAHAHLQPGCVDRLDGGGLYRRSAIEATGYFSDRNLHSYEEFDLAVRLRSLGWKLWRLPVNVVRHFGHETPPYRLLLQRWRTNHLCGLGELVRASAGQPRLRLVIEGLRELRLYLGVLLWWAVLLSVPLWPLSAPVRLAGFGALLLAPLLLMAWRKRSVTKALYSVVSWCFNAAGLVRGLLQPQKNATEAIASQILQETGFSSRPARGFPR
ncbi:MAG: glycosyltransferase [Pseudomonadota bacterium]|nr:glycosyltransferase [Pseudomonadota bacterium]